MPSRGIVQEELTNLSSRGGIVQEELTKDNYKRWKTLMKNYLVGKSLWDTVISESVSQEKNAEVLHIIQLSCEPKILDEISDFDKAKNAWDHLARLYDPEIKAIPDIEQGVVEDEALEDSQRELYVYVKKGQWKEALSKIEINREKKMLYVPTASGRTVLHIATMAGHVEIVRELVKRGKERLVEMKDREGYTALALAAHYTGNKDVAECMVKILEEIEKGKSNKLLTEKNNDGKIPLLLAAAAGHKEMTRYLSDQTPTEQIDSLHNRVSLLEFCIKAEIFDVAVALLDLHQKLPEDLARGFPALGDLARMPYVFSRGCQCNRLHFYKISTQNNSEGSEERLQTNFPGIRKIYEQKCNHCRVKRILWHFQCSVAKFNKSQLNQASVDDAMFHAVKHGNVEFIDAMRNANPDLIWVIDSDKRDLLSYAILHHKRDVLKLIHTVDGRKDILKYSKDVFGNNLLHLAAHLGPSSNLTKKPGAAVLQMQREIQWFKAVEKAVHPKCKEDKNNNDKKPDEIFTDSHENLVKDGEKWAKATAKSFSLMGILIAGIMFAAAFTVPGGNNEATGAPLFIKNKLFIVFLVADALSLFTSITSVVVFIIISSHHILLKKTS